MITDKDYAFRVPWSPENGEHVGLCLEFPSLSWLAATPAAALAGIRGLVHEVVADMRANAEPAELPEKENPAPTGPGG